MSHALEKEVNEIWVFAHLELNLVGEVDRSTKKWENILKYYEKSFSSSENLFLPCGPFTIEPDQETKADCPREEKTQKNTVRTESNFWLRI